MLPTGIITFLFTDIENGVQHWEREPDQMRAALTHHATILRQAIEARGGQVYKVVGDACQAAFAYPAEALEAAVAAQRAFVAQAWPTSKPLRVRIGLHTGPAEVSGDDYVASHTLNRVARIMSAAHGEQILVSATVADLVRGSLPAQAALRDLGQHRLQGLTQPEHLYQVIAPDLPAAFPPLQSLATVLNNLPAALTPLLGREQEIATLCQLLRHVDVRLVTLTGPGGVGKTSLALRVVHELEDTFADGVTFVCLDPISDPDLVLAAVAQALRVQEEEGSGPLIDRLKAHLRDQHRLLVLDNFEQVAPAAPQVADLLAACPDVKVLATSREALHVRGEHEFAVPLMAVPDLRLLAQLKSSLAEVLAGNSAVALFVERARAVKVDFQLTDEEALAVAEICSRLDGLPLAIELAAARCKLFTPRALLAQLGGAAMPLLGDGARDRPARHKTLRDTTRWSYELLDGDERRLLRQLSVFAGGFTLKAAEHVTGHGAITNDRSLSPILDRLTSLVDKSLLLSQPRPDGPRFTMLGLIREFAAEELQRSGEAEAVQRAHAAYYLHFATTPASGYLEPPRTVWLDQLETEHDNFRAALRWSLTACSRGGGDDTELALRLGGALWRFWIWRGYLTEGRRWLDAVRQAAGDEMRTRQPSLWANVLLGSGGLAVAQDDYGHGEVLCQASLALFRELEDKAGIAAALDSLGLMAAQRHQLTEAGARLEEGLALCRELGSWWGSSYLQYHLAGLHLRQGEHLAARAAAAEVLAVYRQAGERQGIGRILMLMGLASNRLGETTTARAQLEEALANLRAEGYRTGLARVLMALGATALKQGEVAAARSFLGEALLLLVGLGNQRSLAACLTIVAHLAAAQGQLGPAVQLLGAAEAVLKGKGEMLNILVPDGNYGPLAGVQACLGEAAFAAAWAEGAAMPLEEAVAMGRQVLAATPVAAPATGPIPAPADRAGLTPRELEVLRLLAGGLSDAQIAEQLIISRRTVNTHLTSIYSKLGVNSRTAAAHFAHEHQLA